MEEQFVFRYSDEQKREYYGRLAVEERHAFLANLSKIFSEDVFKELLEALEIPLEYWYDLRIY